MAFNPFHSFRKYRKAMFAVLAIVCMFTFVLSSGLGGRNDILNVLPEWLGGGGSSEKDPGVARIDGKRIDGRMIEYTRIRRKMADDYMTQMFLQAEQRFIGRALTQIKDEFLLTSRLQTIAFEKAAAAQAHSGMSYGQMQQQQRGMPIPPERALKEHIDFLSAQIDQMHAKKKTEEAEYLTSLRTLLEQDKWRINAYPTMKFDERGRTVAGNFFGGWPYTGENVLEFMVWKWEADRQKIELTPEAVEKLIKQELLGEDWTVFSEKIVEFLLSPEKHGYRATAADLMDAITDEFRVRIAKARRLGESGGMAANPGLPTPNELRKHLSEECKSIRTVLLPIDVDPLIASVTETPTEKELKDLYEKHKKDEHNPRLDRPGFMEPKKVKLEWISGKPDSAYFRKLGQETAAKDGVLIAAASQAIPSLSGVVPAAFWVGGLGAAKFDDIPESHIQREYEKYAKNERLRNWVFSGLFFFNVHETSVVRPENYAATIAETMASCGTGGPVFSPALTLNRMAITQELRERTRFGLQTLATVGGLNPNTIWGINDGLLPQPLPVNVMRPKFLEEMSVQQAKKTFLAEFNKLQDEMKKKAKDAKKPEVKAEIQKLVDDLVKKHNLTRGASTEGRDRYSLLTDPGLKELKERYYKDPTNTSDKLGENASFHFFGGFRSVAIEAYTPTWFDEKSPETALDLTEPFYLTWKTEEVEAKVRPFDVAKKDVEAAWKRIKAREKAEATAKDLQKKITDKSIKDQATLTTFAAENKITPIELEPIAKNKLHPPFAPGMPPMYIPGRIPADKVEYANDEMLRNLLDMRGKPKGEVIVLHDGPKSKYYVVVLLDTIDVTDADFQLVFAAAANGATDQILGQYEFTRRGEYRNAIMAQLRSEANVTTDAEALKKLDDRGSRSED